jgi:hypothetical protein
MDITD